MWITILSWCLHANFIKSPISSLDSALSARWASGIAWPKRPRAPFPTRLNFADCG